MVTVHAREMSKETGDVQMKTRAISYLEHGALQGMSQAPRWGQNHVQGMAQGSQLWTHASEGGQPDRQSP